MIMRKLAGAAAIAVAVVAAGCGSQPKEVAVAASKGTGGGAGSAELAALVVKAPAPLAALAVAKAKKEAKDGAEVAVEGRVKDFVDGMAVFTIVDTVILSCDQEGEACPTPWDYCCEPKESMLANTATVKVVGAGAAPIKANVKGVSGVDHLTTVVATGKARRDEAGNLTIEAAKVFVK